MFGSAKRKEIKLAKDFSIVVAERYVSVMQISAHMGGRVLEDDDDLRAAMLHDYLITLGIDKGVDMASRSDKNPVLMLEGHCRANLPIGLFHVAFYMLNSTVDLAHNEQVRDVVFQVLRERVDGEDIKGFVFTESEFNTCLSDIVEGK